MLPTEVELELLYWKEKLSLKEIGEKYGVAPGNIHYYMKKYNIPRRDSTKPTKETKKKMSDTKKAMYKRGDLIPWNKGKPRTVETKKKLSETHKRLHREGKLTSYNKGKTLEELFGEVRASKMRQRRSEITKKYFETHKHYRAGKRWVHPETCECPFCRAKRGELVGKGNPFYGKKHTEESSNKMSLSRLGDKNHRWLGGSSYKDYPLEFNEVLKRQIRERDNYTCSICGLSGNVVHHINYDKNDNLPVNLITVCREDHIRTNSNRDHWTEYFYKLCKSIG